MLETAGYAYVGSAGGRNSLLNVSVRVFLSDDEGSQIQVTAGGYDAADAVAWAEDWANREWNPDGSYAMDEWEAC